MVQPSVYEHSSGESRQGSVLVTLLALLDEIAVLDGASRIHENRILPPAQGHTARVGHADRLAAGHVHRRMQCEIGDA
jgi:hypothetical protein